MENKTRNIYKYDIVIEDLVNTFVTKGFLKYKITSDDGGYNMTNYKDVPKSDTKNNKVLAYSIEISANTKHNYNIEFIYESSEEVDQSDDMGKILSGNLYIGEGTIEPTLANVMLRDNPTISERTGFSVANTETTTGTIYKTNKTEDGSDVYYYSGNTTNNWVKFGKYISDFYIYRGFYSDTSTYYREYPSLEKCTNATSYNFNCSPYKYVNSESDMYWRLIRTNEDGSVRLLYSGTSPDTTKGYIGASIYNISNSDPIYAGYMYGTSGTIANNRTNENDSMAKSFIDTWYETELLINYDKYISKSAIYCNDRSIVEVNGTNQWYGAYSRVFDNKTPSYKCGANTSDGLFESTQAIEDKFSASTSGGGNGLLKYPIALITADELAFASGSLPSSLSKTYAWFYTNSQGELITGDSRWYSMSPHSKVYMSTAMVGVSDYLSSFDSNYGVSRPALSLSSCALVKSGNGTPESPYEIDYDGSNC